MAENTEKEYIIYDIESLDEKTAQSLSEDHMVIKGHDIYFVDFGGYFGYSALVFFDGHHIHYANDYQLHHKGKTNEELKSYYIEEMNNKLFTEEELKEPLKTYDEYSRKDYFLRNYYGMRRGYVSSFQIIVTEADKKKYQKKIEGMYYNPVTFAYYKDYDFVQKCVDLSIKLMELKRTTLDNYDWWVDAIFSEMCNHEYGINWQADFDTLSAFGCPIWRGEENQSLTEWFADVNFTDTQKKAYFEARRKYFNKADEEGWF